MDNNKIVGVLTVIEIAQIEGKGRGVISKQHIGQSSLVESAPVCQLSPEQKILLSGTPLFDYYFVKPCEYQSEKEQANGYIIFGLSSFCNHSLTPNAKIEWVEKGDGLWAHLIAIRDIQPHKEVTLYYTNISDYPTAELFLEAGYI